MRTQQGGSRYNGRVNPLSIYYQNAQEKLQKYNSKTDENYKIYTAATLLNPCMRRQWFVKKQTGDSVGYINSMITKNRKYWEDNYKDSSLNQPQVASDFQEELLDNWLVDISDTEGTTHPESDEFDEFVNGPRLPSKDQRKSNLFAQQVSSGAPGL